MLIAFNGTGNKDEDDNALDTNVVKVWEAYLGDVFYQDGVGTGGWLDTALGGLFGYGGKAKVKKAISYLAGNITPCEEIDVVGFSRGAALAIDFCNEIEKLGYSVRALMLFDTVASFGLAGNDINIGYDLSPPKNTKQVLHAMSLDERRTLFPLTRIVGAEEVWFRGFHSDVGGGNGNTGLGSIPLSWMLKRGIAAGVPFSGPSLVQAHDLANPSARCSKPADLIPGTMRLIRFLDKVHPTVAPRQWACTGFPANNPPSHGQG